MAIEEKQNDMKKNFDDIAGWYLVANIIENQPYGENGEIRKGTKHFAPHTKIYCSTPRWGDGYSNLVVAGKQKDAFPEDKPIGLFLGRI